MIRGPPGATLFPYTTLFRSAEEIGYPVVLKSTAAWLRHRSDLGGVRLDLGDADAVRSAFAAIPAGDPVIVQEMAAPGVDRKSTRLNSSHANISYAVFCLKKK